MVGAGPGAPGALVSVAGVLLLALASADLPPGRPPAPAFPAEPPAVNAVRRLHQAVESQEGVGPMSEEEMAEDFQRFLDARGGRLSPMWENHSHAERTANLQQHHSMRRSERRRTQAMIGAPLFQADTPPERESNLVAELDPTPGSVCDDSLATNTGSDAPCTYDCTDLQNEYFPEPHAQTTRCFLFDPDTSTWPEVGGQGDELLSLREQRFETHTYISEETGRNPTTDDSLTFAVGEGRICRNVTISTIVAEMQDIDSQGLHGTREEVVVCLVDGEHEYNHTVNDTHSVEVVGYAQSGVHEEAGGTTSFVVGMCTDVLIRVTTTRAGGSSMTWELDDGGHNGPWTFDVPDGVGVQEFESCMFDNEFTLNRQGGGSAWEGSVEVVGFIHYHNTITIPNDENWIVQGSVDPATGLPASLEGRFKSGSAIDRSHANVVLRQMRISNQVAPIDVNDIPRGTYLASQSAFGGAFDYDGGGADPNNLPKIVFVDVVFDHNSAAGYESKTHALSTIHSPDQHRSAGR